MPDIPQNEKEMYLMFAGWKRLSENRWKTPRNAVVDTDYAFLILRIFYE